jgi:PhnB protein
VRLDGSDGRVLHSAVEVYGAPVVVVDEMPEVGLYAPPHYGGSPFSILLDCPDADAAHARAVAAGATSLATVADDFSGGRHGLLVCPFGHRWITSSRVSTMTLDEIRARFDGFARGQALGDRNLV